MVVEQLEMAQLIGGDAAADFFQNGFLRRVRQGGVIGGCAGFHHAAGDQLAAAGSADGGGGVQRDLVAVLVTGEGGGIVPGRVGEAGPFAERVPVLHFLDCPMISGGAKIRIVREHPIEIDGIICAVALHHGGGLDERHNGGIDLGGVELVPGDGCDVPVFHGVRLRGGGECLGRINGRV